jgi:hypothetical protein
VDWYLGVIELLHEKGMRNHPFFYALTQQLLLFALLVHRCEFGWQNGNPYK